MAKDDATEEDKPFSTRLKNRHFTILDALRRQEDNPPSRGGMVKLLIERADPLKKDKRK